MTTHASLATASTSPSLSQPSRSRSHSPNRTPQPPIPPTRSDSLASETDEWLDSDEEESAYSSSRTANRDLEKVDELTPKKAGKGKRDRTPASKRERARERESFGSTGSEVVPRRAAFVRSNTGTAHTSGLAPRPAFPTFLSSRSTSRRTSYARSRDSNVGSSNVNLPYEDEKTGIWIDTHSHTSTKSNLLLEDEDRKRSRTTIQPIQIPKFSRRGTYSSLPPSPTGAILLNLPASAEIERDRYDFASRNLGLDKGSAEALVSALNRVAGRRIGGEDGGSAEDGGAGLGMGDERIRASSLPPEGILSEGHTPFLEAEDFLLGEETIPALPKMGKLSRMQSAARVPNGEEGRPAVQISTPPKKMRENSMEGQKRLSLWDVLREAVFEEEQNALEIQGKWERIQNFLAIPAAIEKNTLLGSLLCLDSFMYYFTILPIRTILAILTIVRDLLVTRRLRSPGVPHIQAILKLALMVIPTVVLLLTTDASKMYHGVRGQDTIKLYVIFNALEIADKLCSAFGQDILDTLFAAETLGARSPTQDITFLNSREKRTERARRRRERARPFFFFILALAYVHIHALVFFYQLVSLNVAVNSYDNALLTLLVSNQFVEIKGSVFKKFEKENLFQIMCADIVERFQLGLMLSLIAARNLIEMTGSDFSYLTKRFFNGKGLLETLLTPIIAVILSEMAVDWLKHGFITKFNHVRTTAYDRYMDVLCKDVMLAGARPQPSGGRSRSKRQALLTDRSTLVTRRLGFAPLPLACLVVRIGAQALGMILPTSTGTDDAASSFWQMPWKDAWRSASAILICVIAWLCLLIAKSVLGLNLLAFAHARQYGMDRREQEDQVNDFGRKPIGDSQAEQKYTEQVTAYLSQKEDNMPKLATHLHRAPKQEGSAGGGSKPKWRLEEVERWTMVKRIF